MATEQPKQPQQAQVFVTWHGVEDQCPAMAANSFLVQQTGQEFILSLGFAALPYYAELEEAVKIKQIPAKPIARVSMTPGRVAELLQLLQQALAAYQAQQK